LIKIGTRVPPPVVAKIQLTNLCAVEAPFIVGELKTFLAIYRNTRVQNGFLIKLDTLKVSKVPEDNS
jgi:hypothetical protein